MRYLPDLNRIETRFWADTPSAVPSAWSTKLTNAVAAPGVTFPFELIPAVGTAKQQLKLTLTAGNSTVDATSTISTTYVARNSQNSLTNAVGASGQSATPVCQRTAVRP